MLPPHKQVDVKNSVEELVKALLKLARTDLEKVRAIWMWICHHIGRLRSSAEKVRLSLSPLLLCHQSLPCTLWVSSTWWVGGRLSRCIYPEMYPEVISPALFPYSLSQCCQALQGLRVNGFFPCDESVTPTQLTHGCNHTSPYHLSSRSRKPACQAPEAWLSHLEPPSAPRIFTSTTALNPCTPTQPSPAHSTPRCLCSGRVSAQRRCHQEPSRCFAQLGIIAAAPAAPLFPLFGQQSSSRKEQPIPGELPSCLWQALGCFMVSFAPVHHRYIPRSSF